MKTQWWKYSYRSTRSLTSALDGVDDQRYAPVALPLYPLYWRLGRPRTRSGLVQKISPLLGFDPRTIHPERVAVPTMMLANRT